MTSLSDTIVIMAPGSSLTSEQVDIVKWRGLFTIAIGDAGRVSNPHANILYHCDAKWWNHYKGCPEYKGKGRVSLEPTNYGNIPTLRKSENTEGLDLRFPYIVTGNNSGYQAINLAMHVNPKQLILLGYDMKDREGKHNVIGNHPEEIYRPYDFKLFKENISTLRPILDNLGVKVYNCTLDSDLDCFEKRNLIDVM